MPTLPIDARAAAFPAVAQGGCALRGLPLIRKASVGASSTSSDETGFTVKNTFIDISPKSDCVDWEPQQRGAKTCAARMHEPSAAMPEVEREPPEDDGCATPAGLQLAEETPWAQNSMPAQIAASLLPAPAERAPWPQPGQGERQGPACSQVKPEGQPFSQTVMLRIPVLVSPADPLAAGETSNLKIDVSETRVAGNKLMMRLRVDVGSSHGIMLDPSQLAAPPAHAAPTSFPPGHLAGMVPPAPPVRPAPLTPPAEVRAATASAPPTTLRGAAGGAAAPPATQKSPMVCCHWKNKGWCKYQDACKFLHPEHKRGAGMAPPTQESARLAGRRRGPPAAESCPVSAFADKLTPPGREAAGAATAPLGSLYHTYTAGRNSPAMLFPVPSW